MQERELKKLLAEEQSSPGSFIDDDIANREHRVQTLLALQKKNAISAMQERELKKLLYRKLKGNVLHGPVLHKMEDSVAKLDEAVQMAGEPKFTEFQKKIAATYHLAQHPDIKLESKCPPSETSVKGRMPVMAPLTMSQEFLKSYFVPTGKESRNEGLPEQYEEYKKKGLLLWHSAGSGKTCAAVAISNSFELEGYTIIWATELPLKKEVKKNVSGEQICDEYNRIRFDPSGKQLPVRQSWRSSWLGGPMTYRTLTNMIQGMNDPTSRFEKELTVEYEKIHPNKRTGSKHTKDRLYKTLLILDETHKMYNGELGTNDQPNVDALQEAIYESYERSGKDSVRVLCLTATPMTDNPFDLFKIVNLFRSRNKRLPVTEYDFKQKFGSSDNKELISKKLEGHISYIDSTQFLTHFAKAKVHDVPVQMSDLGDDVNKTFLKTRIKELRASLRGSCRRGKCTNPELEQLVSMYDKAKKNTRAIPDQVSGLLDILKTHFKDSKQGFSDQAFENNPEFVPSSTFLGSKAGYTFKNDVHGLGYYRLHAAPITADATAFAAIRPPAPSPSPTYAATPYPAPRPLPSAGSTPYPHPTRKVMFAQSDSELVREKLREVAGNYNKIKHMQGATRRGGGRRRKRSRRA
jgi:hypothetical protein